MNYMNKVTMMTLLSEQNCSACDATSELLTEAEIVALFAQLSASSEGWKIIKSDGVNKLSCQFVTKRYKKSMAFCNDVAALAETVNHHPLMVVEYGLVTVEWWSHNIRGLHQNDFIMAAKTSELFVNPIK